MSLKQECVDMFTVIFQSLEDYEDYQIEEDTGVFLCPKENYKDTEYLAFDCCECNKNDGSCDKELVNVDLSVFVPYWAGDEDGGTLHINFNKKPAKKEYKNTIHYINNRKQLIKFMFEVKQRVDDMRNAYAEYAEKVIELRNYGQEFLMQVSTDYPVFRDINVELPIVFADVQKDDSGNCKYEVGGDFSVANDIQLIIHVYDCWRDIEVLKTTVRHEILHYLLFRIGVNYSDEGGLFHYFCNKYDAHAYKAMSDSERKLYMKLMELPSLDISNILEEVKRNIILKYTEKEAV